MEFDVNAEKIYCTHCNKEIGRNDKFIFIHCLLSFDNPKCFCSVDCIKQYDPNLALFIYDMTLKGHRVYMYTPYTITPLVYSENKPLIDAFNLFSKNHHSNRLYIEMDATLNNLKKRLEEQEID